MGTILIELIVVQQEAYSRLYYNKVEILIRDSSWTSM